MALTGWLVPWNALLEEGGHELDPPASPELGPGSHELDTTMDALDDTCESLDPLKDMALDDISADALVDMLVLLDGHRVELVDTNPEDELVGIMTELEENSSCALLDSVAEELDRAPSLLVSVTLKAELGVCVEVLPVPGADTLERAKEEAPDPLEDVTEPPDDDDATDAVSSSSPTGSGRMHPDAHSHTAVANQQQGSAFFTTFIPCSMAHPFTASTTTMPRAAWDWNLCTTHS